jgi:hypothetical protein
MVLKCIYSIIIAVSLALTVVKEKTKFLTIKEQNSKVLVVFVPISIL